MHDIVIRGGTVIDGTGKAAFTRDVAIAGERIAEVGGLLKGFPAEVNRGFPRADRGRILCALIRREVGHARNVSQ